jgi:hypothetical protein
LCGSEWGLVGYSYESVNETQRAAALLLATQEEVCVTAIVDKFVNKMDKGVRIIISENEKN